MRFLSFFSICFVSISAYATDIKWQLVGIDEALLQQRQVPLIVLREAADGDADIVAPLK